MNELELRTLMTMPQETLVPWGDGGKVITISDFLGRIFNGEGAVVTTAPPARQPGQPAGTNLTISQRGVDQLSQRDYDQLQRTGEIEGLTTSIRSTHVHVRQGGTIRIDRSFNPETGAIEAGRGLDLRDFDAPAGS